MADTEWERQIDAMVRQNIKWVFSIRDDAVDPAAEVSRLVQGKRYRMLFAVHNVGSEVHFDRVQVRLVSLTNNPWIQFYSDSTYNNAVPRVYLDYQNLGAAGSGNELAVKEAFFIANRNVERSGDTIAAVLFRVGIYGVVRPEGHAWKNALFLR